MAASSATHTCRKDTTLTINGVDYVTSKNIISLETSWKNNIRMDQGFYPGSDFQTPGDAATGAIRGRLEFGSRQGALKFVSFRQACVTADNPPC
jgi:hypothetical protein